MPAERSAGATRQEFDLSGINTVLSSTFHRRREAFYGVGISALVGLGGVAAWFAIFVRTDPVTLGLTLTWMILLAGFGGAYGFANGHRLGPGPTRLILDKSGLTLI